ncbi:putative penicillin-binding protein [Magnetofaba australis IT-1]|uniref:Putative penicillin-binding protein n=1 Tax=Magnetofaba australis IT-1 TaxID=1434232 RepID=A0A1Y2JYZ8_9PROT|nr:putative penicillin-binding protein [Magnetofaba australis IT-1]
MVGALILGLAVAVLWLYLPDKAQIEQADRGMILRMQQQDGELLELEAAHQLRLPAEALPEHVKQAFIAIEDRRFYYHFGVDPLGVVTSVARYALGKQLGGGSTITQQLAKNLFLSGDRSIWRKLKEMTLAFKLEAYFSKERILELYLNTIYFGDNSYGVETAARQHFGKRASELTHFEAALLAGSVKGPNRYHPNRYPERANARAKVVLAAMTRAGFITEDEEQFAILAGRQPGDRPWRPIQHQYLRDWIAPQAAKWIGDYSEPVRLFTTLNSEYQLYAEEALRTRLYEYRKRHVREGAVLALASDGAVLAMAGGRDYQVSQLNRTARLRQPASSFKPFIYLAALEGGLTPASRINDAPITIDRWSPRNHDGEYWGAMTLADALAHSRNTPPVRLFERIGRDGLQEFLSRFGLPAGYVDGPATALGSREMTLLELTSMYGAIANGGLMPEPYGLYGAAAQSGRIIQWRRPRGLTRVVSEKSAKQMDAMLRRVVTDGTGKRAEIPGLRVVGKTGTNQHYRDALFVGYANGMTVAAWAGNDDNSPMDRVFGGTLPTMVWHDFMQKASNGLYE